jgi:ABC-type antimicrobial peptide transport system permease subunit
VIINNSMLMATMDRVQEIGTMRALGAQRSFVLTMFLIETTVLGLIAGTLGAALALAVILFYGSVGISANGVDALIVLFGGPAYRPSFDGASFVIGFLVILFVSLLSTLYPAFVAARVPPAVAMMKKE